jgi:hypothetical protein
VKSAEGRSSLRLALRLWRADRFDAVASDAFGRSLWRLEVAGGEGRVHAPREHRACRFDVAESIELPGLDLAVPAGELPALLLGRLPAPPAVRELVAAGAPAPHVDPESGERWSVSVERGGLVGWSVERPGGGRVEWRRLEGLRSRLEAGEAFELEWREVAREPLAEPPPAWKGEPPTEECRDAAGA